MAVKLFPEPDELKAVDRRLSIDGVSIVERPTKAMLEWLATPPFYDGPIDFVSLGRWFDQAWKNLHPSVPFSDRPFMYLAVSALGVSYRCDPPVVFGGPLVDPMALIKFTPAESHNIHTCEPSAWWELHRQAVDCLDLWLNRWDFTGNAAACNRVSVACAQLEASARQLVACSHDPALPQGVALIAEMAIKAGLASLGLADSELKAFGHHLEKAARRLNELSPHPPSAELEAVAASLPRYSDVRYDPPPWGVPTAQDFYRRALFVASEAMRQVGSHRIAEQARYNPVIPKRHW
jgi:hypothetical protein